MKWNDIPDAMKMTAAAVVVITGFIGYLTTFQTDVEAQQYQQSHQQELSRFRIQQIEQRISELRYQLLSSNLNPNQQRWINDEIRRLEAQIQCIRNGKC